MNLKSLKKKNNLKKINLIDVNFKQSSGFSKITPKSNQYIDTCFDIAIKLLKNNVSSKFINGPISKKTFLKKNLMELQSILQIKQIQKNLQ
jgi:4-hydroxythreonine-4-phosphate dehydrogenase